VGSKGKGTESGGGDRSPETETGVQKIVSSRSPVAVNVAAHVNNDYVNVNDNDRSLTGTRAGTCSARNLTGTRTGA